MSRNQGWRGTVTQIGRFVRRARWRGRRYAFKAKGRGALAKKIVRWGGFGMGALFVVVFAAFVVIGPKQAVSFVIHRSLAGSGLEPATFTVSAVGWRSVELTAIAIGQTPLTSAKRIRARFGPAGPLGGIRRLEVEALSVTHVLRTLPSAPQVSKPPAAAIPRVPQLPFPVIIEGASLTLETRALRATATAAKPVVITPDSIAGRFDVELDPRPAMASALAPHRGTVTFAGREAAQTPLAVTLELAPAPGADMRLDQVTMRLTAQQDRIRNLAQVSAQVSNVSLSAPGARATANGVMFRAVVKQARRSLTIQLPDCATFSAVQLTDAARTTQLTDLSLCAADPGRVFARLDLHGYETDAPDAVTVHAVVPDGTLRLADAAGQPMLSGALPALTVNAAADSKFDRWQATFDVEGGNLAFIQARAAVADAVVTGKVRAAGGTLEHLSAELVHVRLSDLSLPSRMAPVSATGRTAFMADKGTMAFNLSGGFADLPDAMEISGTIDPGTGAGSGVARLAPIKFDPKGVTPDRLFPSLAREVRNVMGQIKAEALIAWDSAGMTSSGWIELDPLSFQSPLGRFEGIKGRVRLASLSPLMTARPQNLRISLLDIGIPLTDGQISFAIEKDMTLRILDARGAWLDGAVGIKSAVFSPRRAVQHAELTVDRIDAAKLFGLADVKGLSGTGRLSGRIPMRFQGTQQWVENGQLRAEPPGGTLIYRPSATPQTGGSGAILFSALENFHYENLTATINGDLADELSLKVQLKGRNPDLYGGHPIELNVSSEGPFVTMVRKGLYGYRDLGMP